MTRTREENAADLAHEEKTRTDPQHAAQQLTDDNFETVLNEAVADVLEHFDGMGIPPAGEQQHTDLADEIRMALREALSHWCTQTCRHANKTGNAPC